MIPEIKQLEPQLKQILYNCVEHVKATKAALYLAASPDLNQKTFELVTSYQYNPADRKTITGNDDLVDRLSVKRNAFFVNGLASDQRFAEMQFRQGTDRLLATPLFARGRLVGFIDMRDKAGKKPFEAPDLDAAKKIADEMLGLLSSNNLFGLAPVALESIPMQSNATREVVMPDPVANVKPGSVFSPAAAQVIEAAREFMSKRQHSAPSGRRTLTDTDLEVINLLLPATLAIRSAVLACFTATGHMRNAQSVVAIGHVMDDALEMLHEHLQSWLHKKNYQMLPTTRMKPKLTYPFGQQVVPVTAGGISTILSAAVNAQSIDGLVLTVAFEETPEAQAQRTLEVFLRQIEQSVDTAIGATSSRGDRQAIAEKLLQPDFQKFPDLVAHSREVSTVAQRFATALELPTNQVDTIRIAALVHDVGLRLLDYDRLYRRPQLSPEEVRALGEHAIVGAALVEPLLGTEIAHAVLRHHERVDGKGYPSRIGGQQIPLAARVIHISDTWVTMTSEESYKRAMSRAQAVTELRNGAGSQFDAALVEKFLASLDEIVNA